ncbi:hypothetical protein RP20_CCG004512 [Aedes albopictus]|nr:hypothetical protein RP20_CCG004512 [Aedes albopictus]
MFEPTIPSGDSDDFADVQSDVDVQVPKKLTKAECNPPALSDDKNVAPKP